MAGSTGAKAPATPEEALNGIVMAIAAATTVPGIGPHLPLLEELNKMVVGSIQKAHTPQGGGALGRPPGGPGGPGGMGGGSGMGQLMGQPPSGPSAGPQGGMSQSGASQDDVRRMLAGAAGQAS